MNGSSTPYAPALKIGVWVTYSSGTLSQSNVVQFSMCICQSRGNWVGADADGVRLEEQPDAALAAEDGEDLPDDFIHAGDGAERLQRGTIGGMFPRDGRDIGKRAAGPRGGQVRSCAGPG